MLHVTETKRHLLLTLSLYSSMHGWGPVETIAKIRILNPHNQPSPTKLLSGIPVSCSVYEVQQSCAVTQISLYGMRFAGWCVSAVCTLRGKISKASSLQTPSSHPATVYKYSRSDLVCAGRQGSLQTIYCSLLRVAPCSVHQGERVINRLRGGFAPQSLFRDMRNFCPARRFTCVKTDLCLRKGTNGALLLSTQL